MPIGVVPDFDLDEQSVTLVSGDTLLLFTDGMCDCRNPQGKDFGREHLGEVLGGLAGAKAQAACDALVNTLLTHRGGADQDDDVTLVAIHAAG